jgi:glutamine synthetase
MVDFKLTQEEAVEPIDSLLKKWDTKYIRLIVVDLDGNPRAMLIPEYEMEFALTLGIGFDGSSIAGFRDVNESDLVASWSPDGRPRA